MPLQPVKHSPEQRAGAVAAALEPGATLAGVCADAAAGRLVHAGRVLEAFELNVSTLKSWRQRDMVRVRAAEVAAADPAAAVDLLEGRLATLAARKLAHLERRGAANVPARELVDMARALREIRALRHAPQRMPKRGSIANGNEPARDEREQLAAEQAAAWAGDA